MKVSCCLATWFWIVGISKNLQPIVSFVIIPPFTCVIVTPITLLMLWCSKTSILFRSEMRRSQLLHPHIRIFMGMASNIKYLLWRSAAIYLQKLFNANIDEEEEASLLSTSQSLWRLYDKELPIYIKCFVNVTKTSETVMLFVSFASSYALSSRCLFCF